MNSVVRTRICLIFNILTLATIICVISIVGTGKYLNFGPSDKLEIIGIEINTWTKWCIVNLFIIFVSISDTFINEWGMPFISFRIYDPDIKVIKDVGPVELQILANSMYFCSSVKTVIYTLCYVSQLDFALIRVVSGEIASIVTIRSLIKEKVFKKEKDEDTTSNSSLESNGSGSSHNSGSSGNSIKSLLCNVRKQGERQPLLINV